MPRAKTAPDGIRLAGSVFYPAHTPPYISVRAHDKTIIVTIGIIVGAQGGILEARVFPMNPAPCRGGIKRAAGRAQGDRKKGAHWRFT